MVKRSVSVNPTVRIAFRLRSSERLLIRTESRIRRRSEAQLGPRPPSTPERASVAHDPQTPSTNLATLSEQHDQVKTRELYQNSQAVQHAEVNRMEKHQKCLYGICWVFFTIK